MTPNDSLLFRANKNHSQWESSKAAKGHKKVTGIVDRHGLEKRVRHRQHNLSRSTAVEKETPGNAIVEKEADDLAAIINARGGDGEKTD